MCSYEEALLLGPQGQSAKFTQIVVTGRHEAWAVVLVRRWWHSQGVGRAHTEVHLAETQRMDSGPGSNQPGHFQVVTCGIVNTPSSSFTTCRTAEIIWPPVLAVCED